MFELLVVLLVVALSAGIAVPMVSSSLSRYRVQSAAYELSVFLDYSNQLARTESTSVKLGFSMADGTVTRSATLRTGEQGLEIGSASRPVTLESAMFVAVDESSSTRFLYTHEGVPRVGAVGDGVDEFAFKSGTVELSSGGHTATLSVHPLTGSVEVRP